jgi:hypothetical protein
MIFCKVCENVDNENTESNYFVPFHINANSNKTEMKFMLGLLTVLTGIAQWYRAGLRAGRSRVRVPAGAGNFSLHHCDQTSSGAHLSSYQTGTRRFCPWGKNAGS